MHALVTSILVLFSNAFAQSQDEPLFQALTNAFKKEYLSIGVLLQSVADFQVERSFAGNNGFNISNMRIILAGELDEGFGYVFRTNVVSSPAILDAKMHYRISPALTLDAGLFKSPFSAEFLIGAESIDFVNRSQVVTALAPGRQIGVQARGWVSQNVVSYAAGVFNGNSYARNNNDNDDFLYAGRLALYPTIFNESNSSARLEIAVNVAHSHDDRATLGGGLLGNFSGKRTLRGGDFRLTREKLLLSGEAIYARLKFGGATTAKPFGYHATAGYMITSKSQLLLRWDSFTPDGLRPDSRLLIVGYNLWPTKVTELQVNYIIPTDSGDIEHHQLLVNAQLTF
jgi:hypothetical protein